MTDLEKIRNGLFQHRMVQSALSAICGFPASRLSRILKGQDPLYPEDAALLVGTLEEIDRLVQAVVPKVPIDFSQAAAIREILAERRKTRAFVVRFAGGQFAGLDVHGRPVAKSEGMILGGEAAHRICEVLRDLGYQGVNAARVESDVEPVNDFIVAWRPAVGAPTKE